MVLDILTLEKEVLPTIEYILTHKGIAVIRSIILSENGKFNLHT